MPLLLCCVLAGACAATSGRPQTPAPPLARHAMPADTPTAFALPSAFPAWQQSPVLRPDPATVGVPGVSIGLFRGLEAVLVETPHATAAVSLFGGQLLSFVPRGGQDVFWLSPLRAALPTPIRGGAPVCWPYFGRQGQGGDVPSHGFVRTLPWRLLEARVEPHGTTVVLQPPPLEDLALEARLEIQVGAQLRQRLVTRNRGAAPVVFSEALHNYFAVSDVGAVRVEGLDGLTYLDKNDGQKPHRQDGPWTLHDPRDPGRSDRTYPGAGGHYRLLDPGMERVIDLQVRGGRSVVVWNPGQAAAAAMADVGAHWRQFLCVEAANAGPDLVSVAPGGEHVLEQRIRVEPL